MSEEIITPAPDTEGRNVSVAERPGGGYNVKVCAGTACLFAGSMAVFDTFVQEVQDAGLGDSVEVSIIGCHGLCSMSPVVVLSDDTLYGHLKPRDVSKVVEEHLKGGQPVERFLYKDAQTGERIRDWHDIGFYKAQTRIALRDVGVINPETIDAYLAVGGYEAARMALTEKTPEWIIEEVTDSGIRGRGGAGFPTGVKWKFANQSKSDEKYLICNADEGDPGAFMDCSILEGDPHAVIEGMIIGSYAIGAHEGYVYVRAEYPMAVKRLTMAVAAAEERGFLGPDIFGTGWEFNLHLKLGAGAFVCGEETALIASIEGKRGMPRTRPPFPAVSGLWGKPTNINNVETFSNIPWIIKNGAEAYAALGAETSRGTKAFSLAGKIVNGGLVEVPMGSSLRHLIFDVGGGIKDGKQFKAVQLGGPSGGCVPAQPAGHAGRLREPRRDRRHRRLRRHGRGRRGDLHGRPRALLPRLHAEGIVRQVRPLPPRHQAHARDARPHHRRRRPRGRHRAARGDGPLHHRRLALRARRHRAEPRAHDDQVLPRRVRGAHPREALPGRQVQGADHLLHRRRRLHRLHALRQEVPHRRASAARRSSCTSSTRPSASSATPAARSASSTPSRCARASSRPWPARAGS